MILDIGLTLQKMIIRPDCTKTEDLIGYFKGIRVSIKDLIQIGIRIGRS